MMPGLDGFELLRLVRRQSQVPVIMLTARTTQADRVAGLDAGADDYLPKPFGTEELMARIRAVLRRTVRAPKDAEVLEAGRIKLVPSARQVSADRSAVAVTTVEYDATISVRDHGPGVPDDLLGAIFEPFVRGEGDRSRASGGVGLGLAIARRAIGLHRGTIKAQNANPGLLVQIELPGAVELLPETKAISEPCRTSRRTSKNSRC
jgi:nitrogen-specific signal transduction histidine kinase